MKILITENQLETIKNNLNDNFQKWFGNSKVVDKSGNPLILYHGSKNINFNEFTITKDIGYHFAVSDRIANDMTGSYTDDNEFHHNIEPMAVYLSLQNPAWLPDLEFWRKSDLFKFVNEMNSYYKSKNEPTIDFEYDYSKGLIDNLKMFAFYINEMTGDYNSIDGFIYHNDYEGRFTQHSKITYITLNPNQIKSIKNDGSWDINDNNIYS